MRLSKKKVVTLALAVCLLATLSMGTLAWFTAQDEVTNNFYVGDTETDADDVFGIDLWENRDTNGDGDYNEAEDAEKAEGLVYEDILPGEILSKEPHLENTGIHPQFVRAIVTVSPASILKDAMGDDWKKVDLFLAGTDETKWTLDSISYTNDGTESKFVYVYYYNEVLEAEGITDPLFDAVVIPTGLTTAQAAAMESFDVDILGQAIQSEHILADNAKDAFETYWEGVPAYSGASDLYYSGNFDAPVVTPVDQKYTKMYLEDANVTGEAAVKGEETVLTIYLANVTGTVDNAVVIDAPNTIIIEESNFTLPEGGKLVVDNSGDTTTQIIVYNVTVNGELLTRENVDQYVQTLGYVDFYTP